MSRNSTPAARIAVHGGEDVVGGERDVLDARPAVELQVLLDLRLPPALRRLVQRELHLARPVRDDLGHQRRVLGRDVVADELGHVGEAHDAVVEVDPLVSCARRCRRSGRSPGSSASPAAPRSGRRATNPEGRGRCSSSGRRASGGSRRRWRSPRSSPCRARPPGRAAPRGPSPRSRRHAGTRPPRRGPRSRGPSRRRRARRRAGRGRCPARTGPRRTNRAPPDSSTCAASSGLPFSGPR